jgi:hypothetical protein
MRFKKSKFPLAVLAFAFVMSACSNKSPEVLVNTTIKQTDTTVFELTNEEACSRVDLPFDDARKYEARLRNYAATEEEVIDAYKSAADAFDETAGEMSFEYRAVFRALALIFNQYRVALVTGDSVPDYSGETIPDSGGGREYNFDQYMTLCKKTFDFEST